MALPENPLIFSRTAIALSASVAACPGQPKFRMADLDFGISAKREDKASSTDRMFVCRSSVDEAAFPVLFSLLTICNAASTPLARGATTVRPATWS